MQRIARVDQVNPEVLTNVINLLMQCLGMIDPMFNQYIGQAVPPSAFLTDGRLAYADGTNWDPGDGKGLYRYDSDTSSWVKIG